MAEDLNNNLDSRETSLPREKPVQEDLVPLGVERTVEGRQVGVNAFDFGGLFTWMKNHAVQSTVGGFIIGVLIGSSVSRRMEAL